MTEKLGFIKLHRNLLNWEWYSDTNTVRVFIHLLLNANFEDKKWKGIIIKKGQLVTGRLKLASILNLSERSVRTSLKNLKTTNDLTIKTTSQYSIITINNWDKWQSNDQQNDQQTTNKRPTNDQQTTTPKEIKKDKNDKNIRNILLGEFKNIKLSEFEIEKLKEIYKNRFQEAIEVLSSYIEATGKKYKSHYAVLGSHNWVYKKVFSEPKKASEMSIDELFNGGR